MPVHPSIVEFVAPDDIPVVIMRSKKRRKTISSQWRENKLVIQVPAALDEKTEQTFVEQMLKKYRQGLQKKELGQSDEVLEQRAAELDQFYFDGAASPTSVRWVSNQNKRWGSASYKERTIRLSATLQRMPAWVRDYVLVHELAHLVSPKTGHGPEFQRLLNRFQRRADADLYLDAFHTGYNSYAAQLGENHNVVDGFGEDEQG